MGTQECFNSPYGAQHFPQYAEEIGFTGAGYKTSESKSESVRMLSAAAKEAGIVVMNEVGLDPGIDHLYAVKTIGEVHAKGGKVRSSARHAAPFSHSL